jgi:superfamily II DNA helicase RecQ
VSDKEQNKEQFGTYKIASSERSVVNEKRVSFGNELHVIDNENEESERNENDNGNDNGNDVSFIFNKLKKIKARKNVQDENDANDYNVMNSETILQMSQDIAYIKTTLAELVMKLNNLRNHDSSSPPLL